MQCNIEVRPGVLGQMANLEKCVQFIVFHPGTQHSWQTATALQKLGLLELYATSIFYDPGRWPYRIEKFLPGKLAARVHAEFRRFEHPALDPARVRTVGAFEWMERVARRAGLLEFSERLDLIGNRKFVEYLDREVRSDRPFALWGYNSSSLEAFRAARSLGRYCILDRTNGDFSVYNRIMDSIRGQYGEFFPKGREGMPDWLIARDNEEYEASDLILVGSEFALSTLRDGATNPAVADKARVLNYCFDEKLYAGIAPPAPASRDEPVRFLFLGQLNPRKGIHLALEAISRLPASQARLTLVGELGIPPEVFARYADRVDYIPTVARADVPGIMASHDVFLMPTYFEGAGIVLYEALASGMALIQTRHAALAATPDTGIMLDAIDTDHLHAAMLEVIENRDRLDHFRAHAQAEARKYTFASYCSNIATMLDEVGLN